MIDKNILIEKLNPLLEKHGYDTLCKTDSDDEFLLKLVVVAVNELAEEYRNK